MTYCGKRWGFQVSYDRLHEGRLRPCALVWVCRGTVEATGTNDPMATPSGSLIESLVMAFPVICYLILRVSAYVFT